MPGQRVALSEVSLIFDVLWNIFGDLWMAVGGCIGVIIATPLVTPCRPALGAIGDDRRLHAASIRAEGGAAPPCGSNYFRANAFAQKSAICCSESPGASIVQRGTLFHEARLSAPESYQATE
jgi:hypothetical protein